MKQKIVTTIGATAAAFILAAGVSFAQTPTMTTTPTPTTTTTMPSGAPNTGFGTMAQ